MVSTSVCKKWTRPRTPQHETNTTCTKNTYTHYHIYTFTCTDAQHGVNASVCPFPSECLYVNPCLCICLCVCRASVSVCPSVREPQHKAEHHHCHQEHEQQDKAACWMMRFFALYGVLDNFCFLQLVCVHRAKETERQSDRQTETRTKDNHKHETVHTTTCAPIGLVNKKCCAAVARRTNMLDVHLFELQKHHRIPFHRILCRINSGKKNCSCITK